MTIGWIIFGLVSWALAQGLVLALFGLARDPEADEPRLPVAAGRDRAALPRHAA